MYCLSNFYISELWVLIVQDATIKHEFLFDGGKRLHFCHVIKQWIFWLLITRQTRQTNFPEGIVTQDFFFISNVMKKGYI